MTASRYEDIAASPVWEWRHDNLTGTTGGPLGNGRLWRGPHYELYVEQMGEEAAADLRDRVIRGKMRRRLVSDADIQWLLESDEIALTGYALFLGRVIAQQFLLAIVLLAVVAICLGRRSWSDPGSRWRVLVPCIGALLIPIAGAAAGLWFPKAAFISQGLVNAAVFFPVALVMLASVSVLWQERRHGRTILAAWALRVRGSLLATVALLAVAYLGVGIAAAGMRSELARDCLDEQRGDLQHIVDQLGTAWTDPVIPEDAWRDEHPPARPSR
jgi:hypothetical protein